MPSKPTRPSSRANADPGRLHEGLGAISEAQEHSIAERQRLDQLAGELTAQLRLREQEAVARGEERFRLILNSAGEGIYGLDSEGKAIFVNPAAARILGWEPSEMVGRWAHEIFHHSRPDGSPYPSEECPMESSVRDGIPRVAEEEFFWTKDGSCVPVECTTTPIREAGEVVGTVVIFRDISDRIKLESQRHRAIRELEESLAVRDDFLSIAAHELRTPLASLQLHLEGVLRVAARKNDGAPTVEQMTTRLEAARTQLERLNRLVEQLLDVSRLRIARIELQLEEMDLVTAVRDAAARARQEILRSGSSLSIRADGAVRGRWDPIRIDQVVTNLLSNAIKYGAGNPIEISVARAGDRARVEVRDEGIGIPPEKIPSIFQRFERLVSVAHYAGFGLGLWIAHQIVDAHGGKIRVSSAPGKGSTFEVDLPLETPVEPASETAG